MNATVPTKEAQHRRLVSKLLWNRPWHAIHKRMFETCVELRKISDTPSQKPF